jgi:hypothetical protein
MKAIAWVFKDFTYEKYRTGINRIADIINEIGYFDLIQHKFIIIAKKE